MGYEDRLVKILHRINPRPSLDEAYLIFRRQDVQDEALKIAAWQRDDAIEINARLRELGHRPPLNHRNFLVAGVGAGLCLASRAGEFEWVAFTTWNTKRRHDEQKYCAERRIGNRMLQRGCTCLVCLAIVGELNDGGDGRSHKHGPGPCLDPCEMCRDDMRGDFYSLYQFGTIILTENATTGARGGPRTPAQLMAHHGETWWEPNHKVIGLIRGR